ncbi:MAG TPA: hypothetical protein VFT02_09140, partial [Pyrinomonadaceae bacterium]|nr:hypothetical protein [Pyrinomonadaceae bacterium]
RVLDRVVLRVLRGVVVVEGFVAGLVDGLLLAGRPVLPPPIVPPPAAGSCCALVTLAHANKQRNAVREIAAWEIRGRGRRVDIQFSPATQTAGLRLRLRFCD